METCLIRPHVTGLSEDSCWVSVFLRIPLAPGTQKTVQETFIELSQGIPRINSHRLSVWSEHFSYSGHAGNKDQVPSGKIQMKRGVIKRIQRSIVDLQGQEVRKDESQKNKKGLLSVSFKGRQGFLSPLTLSACQLSSSLGRLDLSGRPLVFSHPQFRLAYGSCFILHSISSCLAVSVQASS